MASLPAPTVPRVQLSSQGLEAEEDMIHLIRHAVELGITFFDTADAYGPFNNEILLGKAIKGIRDKIQIATKFAFYQDENGNRSVRGEPEYVPACCKASLKRLDVECIDLYYQHRLDPKVPIEITGALEIIKSLCWGDEEAGGRGKVKYLGLSKASASEIRHAHVVHPITAVQVEWSLCVHDIEDECKELGIGIVPYSPLGRGFLAGAKPDQLGDGDFRKIKVYLQRVMEIVEQKNCSPIQLALAWVQHKGAVAIINGDLSSEGM
ncbi:hypothetical protein CY35_02G041600 [Sphagnum magellanicum]|nr:hypothetical protein CY35_02G041600 [Sphagnum magellanicum]